ncbi:unnamed protein product [Brassica rapa subsp. narinosa]
MWEDKPRNGVTIGPPVPMANSLIQVVGITEEGASLEAASRYILQDKTQLLVSTGLLSILVVDSTVSLFICLFFHWTPLLNSCDKSIASSCLADVNIRTEM